MHLEQARSLGQALCVLLGRRHPLSRPGSRRTAQCILVIIGATPEGKKELVGLTDGVRESAQCWRELLLDLKAPRPGDGAQARGRRRRAGLLDGVGKVWPKTREQRCWVHKTANVLNKLPKGKQAKAKRVLHDIWMAETKADAESPRSTSSSRPGAKYAKAAECLTQGSRRAADVLRLPGRALDASADDQPHRKLLRDRAASDRPLERMPLEQDRARDDVQAREGCTEKLATSQRTQPVAQAHFRGEVRRRNRGRQTRKLKPPPPDPLRHQNSAITPQARGLGEATRRSGSKPEIRVRAQHLISERMAIG